MKTIEIIVSPEGQSRVETRGFAGAECQQASAFLERAIGQRTNEQLTGEYFVTAEPKENIQQKGA